MCWTRHRQAAAQFACAKSNRAQTAQATAAGPPHELGRQGDAVLDIPRPPARDAEQQPAQRSTGPPTKTADIRYGSRSRSGAGSRSRNGAGVMVAAAQHPFTTGVHPDSLPAATNHHTSPGTSTALSCHQAATKAPPLRPPREKEVSSPQRGLPTGADLGQQPVSELPRSHLRSRLRSPAGRNHPASPSATSGTTHSVAVTDPGRHHPGPGSPPPPGHPPIRLRDDPRRFGEHHQTLTTGTADGPAPGAPDTPEP